MGGRKNNFTEWSEILKHLTLLSQLGLTLIMPVLLCMGACWLLTSKIGLGGWVYIPGFILGIGASCTTAYKVYLSVMRRQENKKRDGVNFNRHL